MPKISARALVERTRQLLRRIGKTPPPELLQRPRHRWKASRPTLTKPKPPRISGKQKPYISDILGGLTAEERWDVEVRLAKRTDFSTVPGCWLWMGACNAGGYGAIAIKEPLGPPIACPTN